MNWKRIIIGIIGGLVSIKYLTLPLIDLFILIYDGIVTLMEYWIIGGGD